MFQFNAQFFNPILKVVYFIHFNSIIFLQLELPKFFRILQWLLELLIAFWSILELLLVRWRSLRFPQMSLEHIRTQEPWVLLSFCSLNTLVLTYTDSIRYLSLGKNLTFFFWLSPKLFETLFTLHFKIKKLATNSPRDLNSVLDTINHDWIDPAK